MNYFPNVIGYNQIKKELSRIIDCLNNKEKYLSLGVSNPTGILLYGVPGTGKTTFANEFTNALTNRRKYIIRKDRPDGEFVNHISNTIKEAIENAPSVIMLDDIDKFSNTDNKHPNVEEFVAIQTGIDNAKGKDVFFIATTNDKSILPSSLKRKGRFDYIIEIGTPTISDASEIIRHYLKNKQLDSDVDTTEIARVLEGESTATLECVLNEAGLYAGYSDHLKIRMDDIIDAVLRVCYDTPKELFEKNDYQLKLASYHEAGHALVSEILEPKSVNIICTQNFFGDVGGITSLTRDENYFWNYEKMENRVRVLLAGKAATDIVFNKVETGANIDIRRARDIVIRFIEDYAINSYKYYLESDYNLSNNTRSQFEEEFDLAMKRYYNDARTILINNRDKLDKLANLLIERKVLRQKDIALILAD